MNLRDLFLKSCDNMYETSLSKCLTDYVDENNSCCWYHSVWQYLRLLDMVSAPQWHLSFYEDAYHTLLESKKNQEEINILISATADYSILDVVCSSIVGFYKQNHKNKINIVVLDKCETPLHICKWYMEHLSDRFGIDAYLLEAQINVSYERSDLFMHDKNNYYDLITTDAFLTRFLKENAISVINKWNLLLKDNGHIVTTVRAYDTHKETNIPEETLLVDDFVNKTINRYSEIKEVNKELKLSVNELAYLAQQYATKMVSNDLGNDLEIEKCFTPLFKIQTNKEFKNQQGELTTTSYVRVHAIKER